MDGNQSILELLDLYTDIIDRQAEMIHQLTALARNQATELQNIKTVFGLIGPSETDETVELPFP